MTKQIASLDGVFFISTVDEDSVPSTADQALAARDQASAPDAPIIGDGYALPAEDGHRKLSAARSPEAEEQSPVPGRTVAMDCRYSLHEASHALVQRILQGTSIGFVTLTPNAIAAAMCCGPKFDAANLCAADDDDDEEQHWINEILDTLPREGEPIIEAADVYAQAHARVTELVAGTAGEEMFCPGAPLYAHSDELCARANASLVCSSRESIERFVDFARAEARSLLRRFDYVVRAIADELLIHRTLDGAEVDAIIAGTISTKAAREEGERRAARNAALANAATFNQDWSVPE